MTNEDKRLRRKELNRLAAQRSRQKKKSVASTFEKVGGSCNRSWHKLDILCPVLNNSVDLLVSMSVIWMLCLHVCMGIFYRK